MRKFDRGNRAYDEKRVRSLLDNFALSNGGDDPRTEIRRRRKLAISSSPVSASRAPFGPSATGGDDG